MRLPRRQPAQPAQRCSSCSRCSSRRYAVSRPDPPTSRATAGARSSGRTGRRDGGTGRDGAAVSGRRAPLRPPRASRRAAPGTRPVICSTWSTAWWTRRSRPPTTAPPRPDQAAASGGGPGLVEHVEEGAGPLGDGRGERVGGARRGGRDDQRRVERLGRVRPVGGADRRRRAARPSRASRRRGPRCGRTR